MRPRGRLIHFGTSNEFADWETVLHTFTYANAVDQALRRAPSNAAGARNIRWRDVGAPGPVPERAQAGRFRIPGSGLGERGRSAGGV